MSAADPSTPAANGPAPRDGDVDEVARLTTLVDSLQSAQVEDWVRLVRFGAVVPRAVETSLSWRITRPLRLGQTAIGVLRRDGANRFWAAVRVRLKRLASRG